MIENEIADGDKAAFEQQIRWGFQKARAGAEALAKFEKTGTRFDASVRNIGGKIIQRLCVAGFVVGVTNAHSGSATPFPALRGFFKHAATVERSARDVSDRFVRARDASVKNR